MQTYYTKWYSPSVGREMEIKVYGHAGRPVLFIPCQDGRFFDFENYRMTDAWAPWIESGQCMVFSIDGTPGIIAFGCSLGATHAANLYFRFPETFDGLLALSGIYTSEYGFPGYMDELVYANSPVDYLAGISPDHPFIRLYNDHKAVVVVGQGAWEVPESTFRLRDICAQKDIHVWFDIWGYDVKHDWDWWYQQVAYHVPHIL